MVETGPNLADSGPSSTMTVDAVPKLGSKSTEFAPFRPVFGQIRSAFRQGARPAFRNAHQATEPTYALKQISGETVWGVLPAIKLGHNVSQSSCEIPGRQRGVRLNGTLFATMRSCHHWTDTRRLNALGAHNRCSSTKCCLGNRMPSERPRTATESSTISEIVDKSSSFRGGWLGGGKSTCRYLSIRVGMS